ncbi:MULTISPECIES: translation elongation factor Ts [Flectobacillus]|jgi:elongation factor Ts|uniref:Elongation factor Ts n=1 Tax=Flectobacillus roseus TaxID=502259 RepID=A0ABT6YBS1_9BACT|nr:MULTISPECIES: translation elongation factor Ts [Flectobacillus]MDI9861019.1 translation elongation factor Ts [Flectobacillus roseus]MDI9870206.1 translation elongation factor Ts [Flectobacillus roseus]NBA76609.1 elongation factor Ts [Emticicia sp. ODNR4P]PAC32042.1 translation elongation factor Ts [Flectobacillus sp. BAB-3569]
MAITAADVNKLRQMTGAGMMDCKKALTEANGDFEAAIDILRKAGQKVAAKRADNATNEGVVLISISEDGSNGKLLALACETEPVSKVADFNNLASALLEAAVSNNAATKEEVLAATLSDGRTAEENIIELTGKIGEKITIAGYENVTAEKVVSYIHSNNKIGVLVAFANTSGVDVLEVGKDIAMQITAMKPVALDKDGVDAATIEREIEIGKDQARAEGKPEAMLEKIAVGKLEKFYKESTLLNQQFVKDSSINIKQLLEQTQKGLTITEFKRIALA